MPDPTLLSILTPGNLILFKSSSKGCAGPQKVHKVSVQCFLRCSERARGGNPFQPGLSQFAPPASGWPSWLPAAFQEWWSCSIAYFPQILASNSTIRCLPLNTLSRRWKAESRVFSAHLGGAGCRLPVHRNGVYLPPCVVWCEQQVSAADAVSTGTVPPLHWEGAGAPKIPISTQHREASQVGCWNRATTFGNAYISPPKEKEKGPLSRRRSVAAPPPPSRHKMAPCAAPNMAAAAGPAALLGAPSPEGKRGAPAVTWPPVTPCNPLWPEGKREPLPVASGATEDTHCTRWGWRLNHPSTLQRTRRPLLMVK